MNETGRRLATGLAIAILGTCASAASAQVHGIPASATSISNVRGSSVPVGIPASATSLGPRGFGMTAFENPRAENDRDGDRREDRRENRRIPHFHVPFYGYGYPIYPYPYNYNASSMMDTPGTQAGPNMNSYEPPIVITNPAPPQPQIIVIDNRGTHAASSSERAALLEPAPEPKPEPVEAKVAVQEDSGPMTVLVFRDGTRKEVKNYAIMGKELIEIGTGSMKRYPISDIDVAATTKENDGRGLSFKMP